MAQNIGTLLKEKREKLGLSLEEVSSAIKVRTQYLRILEEDINENEIPEAVYMLGYLKLYANFLGLDGKEIVEKVYFHFKEPDININSLEYNKNKPSFLILMLSLILLVALLFVWSKIA
jgi:cytoskeletal protein RodZ